MESVSKSEKLFLSFFILSISLLEVLSFGTLRFLNLQLLIRQCFLLSEPQVKLLLLPLNLVITFGFKFSPNLLLSNLRFPLEHAHPLGQSHRFLINELLLLALVAQCQLTLDVLLCALNRELIIRFEFL